VLPISRQLAPASRLAVKAARRQPLLSPAAATWSTGFVSVPLPKGRSSSRRRVRPTTVPDFQQKGASFFRAHAAFSLHLRLLDGWEFVMISSVLVVAMAVLWQPTDTTRASREAFTGCLRTYVEHATNAHTSAADFAIAYPQQCMTQQTAFHAAIISRERASRASQADAEESANLEIEDARTNFSERFAMSLPATPAAAPATATAAATPATTPAATPAATPATATTATPAATPASQTTPPH
jgi:hypothetical protein